MRALSVEHGTLTLPENASPAEAAAIAAAIGSHIRDQQAAAAAVAADRDDEQSWEGRRFAFAGRSEALSGTPHRVPAGSPTDDWTAYGRLEDL